MEIRQAIAQVMAGEDLAHHDIAAVFGSIMEGQATPAQIGALLVALRIKGETADEIAGAASAMRARALPIACPDRELAVDTCGTGGDACGRAGDFRVGAEMAAAAIDSGRAAPTLDRWARLSREAA